VRWLLDTCILSEVSKLRPEPKVLEWLEGQEEESLFISTLTIGAFQKGAALQSDLRKQKRIAASIEALLIRFERRLLPVNAQVAIKWGIIQAAARRRGHILPAIDALLAATAIAHDLTFVTRNTKDVELTGVNLLDPWL
jgi:predicted nucleic acid-binding protein